MLLPCPWCGPRNATEFRYGGEAGPRPDPATTTPEEWRRYLYFHANPRGWHDRELVPRLRAAAGTSSSSGTRVTNEVRAVRDAVQAAEGAR